MDICELVKIDVASKAIGLSRNYLYRLSAEGKIPYFKAGKALRFDIAELKEWMREQAIQS